MFPLRLLRISSDFIDVSLELHAYKKKHGHTNVQSREGSLGTWVRYQRRYYRLKQEGKSYSLTDKREDALNELGFTWT